jgi:hypothetical protein
MTWRRQAFGAGALRAAGAVLVLTVWPAVADTNRFGFSGPEIFPIDAQISHLRVADLNGDKANDLVVVNNARSKINILYNRTGATNRVFETPVGVKNEINQLPPDSRFQITSIPSEKRISALVVEDLNGDGRPDIAYYGDPRELVVLYNEGGKSWSAPRRIQIEDGQLTPNALCAGDLNGDGRTDLVLLSDSFFYFIPQKEDRSLGEPEKVPFSGSVRSAQVVDLNGDGRGDLLLVNWEDRNPFRVRFQQPDGRLGMEMYFPFAPIRSYWADNLDAKPQTQIITISQNSGRAQVSELVQRPAENLSGCFSQGQFQVLPLNRTERAKRGSAWADIDGDGLPDLLVAEPESGQLSLYLQKKDGSLSSARTFPTLAGISDVAVGDWDGDGKPEVFLMSLTEQQVGVTRLDNKQRLPFPTLLTSLEGKPLAMALGKLKPGAKPVLAMILEQDGGSDQVGRRSLLVRTADGKSTSQKLSKEFQFRPTTLAFHDVDQDGLSDLVVLTPYEKVKVLRQVEGKEFEELDVALPGGALEQPWLSTADLDGDGKAELLLTQKNFIRSVVLTRDPESDATNRAGWLFTVKDQINGTSSNSRLVGAAAVANGTNAVTSVFLLDAERKAVTLCERDSSGVWQPTRNVPLPVAEFASLQPLCLRGTNINALGFLGLNLAACLALDGQVWQLAELDSYETPIKDGRLNDVVSGDLDADGRKDLVFMETSKNYLDLVIFDHQRLIPATRWQVFEERTFRNRRGDLPEPREAAIADVTGRGKNDLIVLVHDRILVYPQE